MTLSDHLRRHARERKDRCALLSPEGSVSYEEMDGLVDRLARGLRRAGVRSGDRLGILMRRRPEAVFSYLGAMRCRAAAVPLGRRMEPPFIARVLARLEPVLVLADEDLLPLLGPGFASLPPGCRVYVREAVKGRQVPGSRGNAQQRGRWEDLLRGRATGGPLPEADAEEAAYIDFTSGTTGIPRGLLTTHRAIAWNTASVAESLGLVATDVHLPLFAAHSHPHEMFARSLTLGGTAALLDSLAPRTILAAAARWGVTCVMALPPVYEGLHAELRRRRYDLRRLRLLEAGGMVTPWSLVERFQREAGKRILPVWGSTETAGVTLGDDQALEAGDEALGRPCAGVEVRVLDEAGGPVPEGEVGEMALRCGSLYRRLIRLDGQGEEAAPGDEHRTGDLVWRDGRGRLHFASRQDEMIKVAGLKVYPAEIEGVLRRHPAVAEAVVTAARSRSRGMVPRAHVVARAAVRPAELRRFCREFLAPHKVPRRFRFLDSLPRTSGGKPDRRSLAREED